MTSPTRGILALAWPVLIGQWATMAYGVADTIMVGHASPADLAAMALGSSIYISVFVGLMGVVVALNPIIAQHYGAQRDDEIGKSWVQGLWLALWLTGAGAAALAFPDVWLMFSNVEDNVHDKVRHYLYALLLALPAALLFRTIYALNTAVSRPKIVMKINLIGLAVKIPLNYVLIYGKLGLPALGAMGCGIATAISMWLTCLLGLYLVRNDDFYKRFVIRFAWPEWVRQKEILRLGIPTGMSYIVEGTSFTFMALLVARLGTSTTGGHQIIANLAAFCFMIPLALAVSTSTLTAQAIGAGDAQQARRTAMGGLRIAFVLAASVALLMWFSRGTLVNWYTNDAAVAAIALPLLTWFVFFHISDALQCVAGFALRAYKHAVAPMVIYAVALWGVGLVGGYWITFHPVIGGAPLGVAGMWLAASFALMLAAITLIAWLGRVSRRHVDEQRVSTRQTLA